MGVSCHPSPAGILSGAWGKNIPTRWSESYPRADESCEDCGFREGPRKAERDYCRFFNQAPQKQSHGTTKPPAHFDRQHANSCRSGKRSPTDGLSRTERHGIPGKGRTPTALGARPELVKWVGRIHRSRTPRTPSQILSWPRQGSGPVSQSVSAQKRPLEGFDQGAANSCLSHENGTP